MDDLFVVNICKGVAEFAEYSEGFFFRNIVFGEEVVPCYAVDEFLHYANSELRNIFKGDGLNYVLMRQLYCNVEFFFEQRLITRIVFFFVCQTFDDIPLAIAFGFIQFAITVFRVMYQFDVRKLISDIYVIFFYETRI